MAPRPGSPARSGSGFVHFELERNRHCPPRVHQCAFCADHSRLLFLAEPLLNHGSRFKRDMHPLWKEMGRYRMRPEAYQHAPEDQLLKEMGFYALDCYLAHWTRHNAGVLDRVPPERLLVVRTDQIGQRAFKSPISLVCRGERCDRSEPMSSATLRSNKSFCRSIGISSKPGLRNIAAR